MEKLIIENFGPIKKVSIDLKRINILIGTTSSGKSVIAKLFSIFKSPLFLQDSSYDNFQKKLKDYNINYSINENTVIKFATNSFYWTIKKNLSESNFIYNDLLIYLNVATEFLGGNDFSEDNINKKIPFENLKNTLMLNMFFASFVEEIKNKITAIENSSKIDKKILKTINNKNIATNNTDELGNFFGEIADLVMSELLPVFPLYVPAERMLLSMVGESLFGLTSNDVNLPKCFTEFGNYFEKSRNEVLRLYVSFLNVGYSYKNKSNILQHADGTQIKLENASSGLQSILPLLLVLYKYTDPNNKQPFPNLFVIEEPELNLFPTTQVDLMYEIIGMINNNNSNLIITTHSPYVISTIDNMIQAQNVVNINPESAKKVNKIINENKWIDFSEINCYYINKGIAKNLMDSELKSIKGNQIDLASELIDNDLNNLLALLD